jgi:hypothetical protein
MIEETLEQTLRRILEEVVIPKIETNFIAIVEQVEKYNKLHAQVLDVKQVLLFNRTVSDQQREKVNERLEKLEHDLLEIKNMLALDNDCE